MRGQNVIIRKNVATIRPKLRSDEGLTPSWRLKSSCVTALYFPYGLLVASSYSALSMSGQYDRFLSALRRRRYRYALVSPTEAAAGCVVQPIPAQPPDKLRLKRLDGLISKCLKQLLMVRGVKSLSPASSSGSMPQISGPRKAS